MRRLAMVLLVVAAIAGFWLYSNHKVTDSATVRSLADPSSGRESPEVAPIRPGIDSDVSSDEPESERLREMAEAQSESTESESGLQAGVAVDPRLAEILEKTLAECQPGTTYVDSEGFACAVNFEGVDANWGSLIEAHVMGTLSENQANLLSLSIQCKTTICGIEVKQAELPPLRDQPENDPWAMFDRWLQQLGESLSANRLQYSGIKVRPRAGENTIIWDVWITRLPYD